MSSPRNGSIFEGFSPSARNLAELQAVDISNLGSIIRERQEALGLSQSRLARFCGLSRQTLVGLEAGALSDLGLNRAAQVPAVLGLDLDLPRQVARNRKRGLWMAAKNASVSYVQ